MLTLRHADKAALYLMFWLAVQTLFAFFLPAWSAFSTIFACALPIFCMAREGALGARDTNARRFPKVDYLWLALFSISGCVLLSFGTSLLWLTLGGSIRVMPTPFFYGLVFSCLLPAFFEEWLFRGHVLRLLSVYGGVGVWISGIVFGFSHMSVVRVPYAIFAGILLSALVLLTENIYLAMALHALNNVASLFLSRINGDLSAKIAILMLALIFVISLFLLHRSKLGRVMRDMLFSVLPEEFSAAFSPLLILFILIAAGITVYNSI